LDGDSVYSDIGCAITRKSIRLIAPATGNYASFEAPILR